ncbi:arylesterase [Spongiibacter taiwanensis]
MLCTGWARADTVLLLGDSLSAAYRIPQEASWPELMAKQFPEAAVLKNASVSGETTAGGLARLPALLAENEVDLLIIELGGNDGLRGYPIASIRQNLEKMIKLGQAEGAQVLLVGMHIPPNYGRRYTEQFHQIYVQLAKTHELPLVPFLLEGVATNPALMQSDGIHPTAEAQPVIRDLVTPAVLTLLSDNHP